MAKVTGIGGVFFRSKNPEKTRNWYRDHLGFNTDEYGAMFKARALDNPERFTHLQWSAFPEDTNYFAPDEREFMINYTVDDLEALVSELKSKGVVFTDEIASYSYGKFIHLIDGDGRKVELWEPTEEGGFE